MKFSAVVLLVFFSISGNAIATTVDTGKITSVYADTNGTIAVTLDNNFSNAQAASECSTANGYAGYSSTDPLVKSMLLAAKVSQQTVMITTQGCAQSGAWYRLINVYLK